MREKNDYIQLPPMKKDTSADVVSFIWEYMKLPEEVREKVKSEMAYIRKRKNSYSVVYRVKNVEGIEHQKSESYATQKEAEKKKLNINSLLEPLLSRNVPG